MITRPKVWVTELAGRFWAEVGDPPPFPRDLRTVACWLTDLEVQEVAGLTLASAAERFQREGIPATAPPIDRALHGCFGAFRERGLVLIDPNDAPDQLRFTFAHELAHFLHDYRQPRRAAVVRFGPSILEVLDGDRPATFTERLAGALRNVPLGAHAHFLERDTWGRVTDERAHEAERAADRLAFELLAPFDAVAPEGVARPALVARLISAFGLPPACATQYAALLLR
ncbi:MAG TPA: ImmA/IrrE family metallo-endopeptidase [Gemmata sp.]